MNGKKVMNGGHEYTFNHKNYNKDITTWATEILWWGRKNKSYGMCLGVFLGYRGIDSE